ncbi:MAG TPA: hypothetical protein VLB84_01030 [Bacteroidia bacterium]|nr:hypothetical protein [Bacteroidia bacterium]
MKTPQINISNDTGKLLIKAALAVMAFFTIKKAFANKAEDNADNQIDTNPAAGQARALNAAMNPSGNNWMREFDFNNPTAIYNIAKQITNLKAVKDFYSAQTGGRKLHEDLTSEIGAEGYNKFLALATKGSSGDPKYSQYRKDIPANRWIVTTANANVRRSPKKDPFNIVKTVSTGRSIGITTGKYIYDEFSDVTFIEFFSLDLKTNTKKYFFVAKSQVELLTKAEKDKREKIAKLPFEVLTGVSAGSSEEETKVVSTATTSIYNEAFIAISTIPANIIVGIPLLTLNTGKGIFIKVRTIQNKIRWVKAQDVTLQNR